MSIQTWRNLGTLGIDVTVGRWFGYLWLSRYRPMLHVRAYRL